MDSFFKTFYTILKCIICILIIFSTVKLTTYVKVYLDYDEKNNTLNDLEILKARKLLKETDPKKINYLVARCLKEHKSTGNSYLRTCMKDAYAVKGINYYETLGMSRNLTTSELKHATIKETQ